MGWPDAFCKGAQQKKADRCRFHLIDVGSASLLVAVVLPVCEAAGRCCARESRCSAFVLPGKQERQRLGWPRLKITKRGETGMGTTMTRSLRGPTLPSGLTPKQEGFARAVAGGANLTEAYRLNYDCSGMKDETIWKHAWAASKHEKVARMIEQERQRLADNELHDAASAKAWALERLKIEATKAETDGSRVRAIELVMRHHGLLTDKVITKDETERPAAEIRAALEARLQERLGVTIVADAEVLDVEEEDIEDEEDEDA
jgi:hypothetical protein